MLHNNFLLVKCVGLLGFSPKANHSLNFIISLYQNFISFISSDIETSLLLHSLYYHHSFIPTRQDPLSTMSSAVELGMSTVELLEIILA